jgi:biotin-(acetyl-CoA carboxylase) ligase
VSNMVLAGLQRGLELLATKIDLPTAFAAFDVLKDKQIELSLEGVLKQGMARGIDSQGCLKLECDRKLERICNSQARGSIKWSR